MKRSLSTKQTYRILMAIFCVALLGLLFAFALRASSAPTAAFPQSAERAL